MTAQKLSAVTLAAAAFFAIGAAPVHALDVSQEQELEQYVELECETGSYGQTTTCKAKAEQRGEQRQDVLGVDQVVLENGTVIYPHVMADTSVSPMVLFAAATITLLGAGAAAYKVANNRA